MRHLISINASYYDEFTVERLNTEALKKGVEQTLRNTLGIDDLKINVEVTPEHYTLEIQQENHSESPRDWDNIGTMVCRHTRYNLGDRQFDGDMREELIRILDDECGIELEDEFYDIDSENEMPTEAYEAYIDRRIEEEVDKHLIIQELYLYNHGGITISTKPFCCPWDSGCVGFIYATRERFLKEMGRTEDSYPDERFKTLEEHARYVFDREVKLYDHYLQGDVWFFVLVDIEGELVDSCGGFCGTNWDENGIADHISPEHRKLIRDIRVYNCVGDEIDQLDYEEVFND